MPIHAIIYYYSIKNKGIDINRSFQTAIRLLISTRVDIECTLDELVQFVIKQNKGNKLEVLKKDGIVNNIEVLDSIDVQEQEEAEVEVQPEVEVEVDECNIDGITYLKDDKNMIYNPDTEEIVGRYNFHENKWLEYKETVFSVYENAMKLHGKGDHTNMVKYLTNHMDLFGDKKYVELRRIILEKARNSL